MLPENVAARYAEALFSLAEEKGMVAAWEKEMLDILEVYRRNWKLSKIFSLPHIPGSVKKDILQKVFQGRICEQLLSFLFLLVDKRREEYLETIVELYRRITEDIQQRIEVEVVTPVELSLQMQENLKISLGKFLGKSVTLKVILAPELIGGLRVNFNGKLLDWSLKARLEMLGRRLAQGESA